MKSVERREKILKLILKSDKPVSGTSLAEQTGVSRQIIVNDIAALKENGNDIISTSRGYIIKLPSRAERVYKVVHTDEEIEKELCAIVDNGGEVKNVFVWHRVYGRIEAELNVASAGDVSEYIKSLKSGRSSPLKNVTSGYHYHTVYAENEAVLDKIEEVLKNMGFLVSEE